MKNRNLQNYDLKIFEVEHVLTAEDSMLLPSFIVTSGIDRVLFEVCNVEARGRARDENAKLSSIEHADPGGMKNTPRQTIELWKQKPRVKKNNARKHFI